ncbi:MAG: hypothetical protein AAF513_12870 [Pseudomonadota bacterium]
MKQFFCELLFICTVAGPGAKPVDELTYGTVLYDYYQADYQNALVNALVAQKQGRRGEDTIRFDLATGSFAFADGMYGYASDIFAAVPEGELTDLDSMRLAFHLAREFHRRRAWDDLDTQLARIDLGKSWLGRARYHPEVEYMKGELAVAQQNFPQAEAFFDNMDRTDPLRAYGLFNLGVAYRTTDRINEARATFGELADLTPYSQEAYDLSQRAKLALALIARKQQDMVSADAVLKELPADGRYQEVAMAAFGGLAMDREDYELAARIWMTLQEEGYWTASTATARLGFPVSLERLALTSQRASSELALLEYQRAERSFSARLEHLQVLERESQDPAWVQGLLQVFASHDRDPEQMQVMMEQWREQLGHTDWLEWLATDKVHQGLVQWRELNAMEDYLGALPEHLSSLQEVTFEQRRRGAEAKALLVDDGLLARKAELVALNQSLAAQLRSVATSTPAPTRKWMYPLATADERRTLDDLAQMRGMIVHMAEHDQAKWSGRIARLEGVFFYRIVAARAARAQTLRAQHREMQRMIAEIEARIERVSVAERNFAGSVGADFDAFTTRATAITAQVRTARDRRATMLAQEIRGRMQQEMQQVQQYLLVTRIAIARATDQLAAVIEGGG